MRAIDVIERKRDGRELHDHEIAFVVNGYVSGEIPDYQMSAWCMAVLLRGMSEGETESLTRAMIASGDRIDLSSTGRRCVDKHSTGGVGDKVTFVVAPVLAHLGAAVPMLSGRGLGHTGGTLDKLEAIPGFRAELSADEFARVTHETGMAIAATSDRIVPADKHIYALRDASGTVPSLPLVVSSIMSKKLAIGADALVLDVKVGNGALFGDVRGAREFADAAIALGRRFGRDVRAVFTAMDNPLGRAVGNAIEVAEALDVLRGGGPADVVEVSAAIGAQMMLAAGQSANPDDALSQFRDVLASGAAVETFERWAAAQGGDMAAFANAASARRQFEVSATESGYVAEIRAIDVGRLSMQLGAGRARKDDAVDPAAGIVLHVARGDEVHAGTPLATLHTNLTQSSKEWERALRASVRLIPSRPEPAAAVLDVATAEPALV